MQEKRNKKKWRKIRKKREGMRDRTIKILFKTKFNINNFKNILKKQLTLFGIGVKMFLEQKKPSTTGTC